jgi:cleavage and polyadenylation specificity factor subunit 1
MHAIRQEILPPSGVEFAASLQLIPSTLEQLVLPTPPNATARHELAARALCNLVVARSNLLRIFEVCVEPAPLPTQAEEDERERRSKVRRGTEAVEGEVQMDEQGEGFVNMGSVKVISNTYVLMEEFLAQMRFFSTIYM